MDGRVNKVTAVPVLLCSILWIRYDSSALAETKATTLADIEDKLRLLLFNLLVSEHKPVFMIELFVENPCNE